MNEQLVVKNFGPIKEATVDFKRVTVFIGPTGGGKSTLAKLAAIFRDGLFLDTVLRESRMRFFKQYLIENFFLLDSSFKWKRLDGIVVETDKHLQFDNEQIVKNAAVGRDKNHRNPNSRLHKLLKEILASGIEYLKNESSADVSIPNASAIDSTASARLAEQRGDELLKLLSEPLTPASPVYILSERIFVSSIEYSWAGLMRDNIGLSKALLDFANNFSLARKEISELEIPFFKAKYFHINGRDFIKIPEREEPLMLLETASGIQSVTPLLVLLEHLSRNTEQAQSFIIEEPELNLYPTAQQGLLNWLVEKCTKGENDLTITTHSPYILSHLNLLLYAHQVAEQHPDRAEEVAALVPRASWINPKEFACYQVENGGVSSLVNEDLGLIDDNGLDNLSGDAADAFDNLIRLSKSVALK